MEEIRSSLTSLGPRISVVLFLFLGDNAIHSSNTVEHTGNHGGKHGGNFHAFGLIGVRDCDLNWLRPEPSSEEELIASPLALCYALCVTPGQQPCRSGPVYPGPHLPMTPLARTNQDDNFEEEGASSELFAIPLSKSSPLVAAPCRRALSCPPDSAPLAHCLRQKGHTESLSQSHCSSFHVLTPYVLPCLTSALNVVDQLPLCCVVCGATVKTFGLVHAPPVIPGRTFEPFCLPPSTDEDPVLRLDNVPWDITPPAILTFLGVSSSSGARAHVLLDRFGKTQSHAFIELPSEAAACSVLRGEHRGTPMLGVGRRARAITLTRSSQAALMAALFPSAGTGNPAPSLRGVVRPSLLGALEVMRQSDLTDLLWLIRTQNARFVKAPSLPFYALASILAKFPADRDRRVFRASHEGHHWLRGTIIEPTNASCPSINERKLQREARLNIPSISGSGEVFRVLALGARKSTTTLSRGGFDLAFGI
ncbi:hypothetical protein B0H14DRAFT_3711041 [Mycena olivaceomarginata]|nr:hypothetical protein B0H14DRAFT_3711041 [Mycena olivaceomarginata]